MPWIARKNLEALKTKTDMLIGEVEKLLRRPFVTNVETSGRKLIFIINKDGVDYTIETITLWSTDLKYLEDLFNQ